MKSRFKLLGGFLGITMLMSCSDDLIEPIEVIDPESNPVIINFWTNNVKIKENQGEALEVIIPFSAKAPGEGLVKIKIESNNATYGVHFTTDPEMIEGQITFPIQTGAVDVKLKITPVNDNLIGGHKDIHLNIIEASGAVQKGSNLGHLINLIDDELVSKPKSYEVLAGDQLKKEFEYDAQGRIAKVNWETKTPFVRTGTETYFYNENDELIRINENPFNDTYYTWTDGRITKSEMKQEGVVTQYADYSYDGFGNVSGTAFYYKQSTGEFKLGMAIDYLYFLDGNLYKTISSLPVEGSDEFITLSTKTYDSYVEGTSPFPMVNILPNINPQSKLPTYYKVEENGFEFTYQISYHFDNDGFLIRREAASTVGAQITHFNYY